MNKAKMGKGADILLQAGITLFFVCVYTWPPHDTFADVWRRWMLCLGSWQFISLLAHLACGAAIEKTARQIYLIYWAAGILLTLLFMALSFVIVGVPFFLLMFFAGLPLLLIAYWILCLFEFFFIRSPQAQQ